MNQEMIKKMNGLEYLIALRYHAVMIGIKYGIKTLAINYDPKVETLAKFVKIPCINFDEEKMIISTYYNITKK